MGKFAPLVQRLPQALGAALCALSCEDAQKLEEIRVYAGAEPELVIDGTVRRIPACVEMSGLLASLSAQALYSCERQMAEGYIPLPGGHRAGVCGRMTRQMDGTLRMTDVSSVCIRIARPVPDASLPVRRFLLDEMGCARRVLVLGAPGSGKTTLLRDAALWLSQQGLHVAVADEREELFAGAQGRLNVLCGMDKALAFSMLLRAMAPQVIVSDELGGSADVQAVLDAVRCGVGLLVSAHAGSMEEAARRPVIRQMMEQEAFDWHILLGRRAQVTGVYDRMGHRWEENNLGQLGCGRDGDDRRQRGRISAFGR
ncbi:MAG: Flp pilus assembly complex ATPase component TadA [Clostridia bacterium]|nr:Flp pilus assembly complex ATPase component TadA [Clostridia bacterium]